MRETAEFCGFAQCPLQSRRAPPQRTHSNLFKLDVWEVKNKMHTEGKSCSGQNPKLFFKTTTCGIFESYFFFCCRLSFYGAVRCRGPSVAFWCWKDFVQGSALPRDVCVTFLKLLLQNSIFSCENPLQMAFLWGSLRIVWSKLCKRLCLLSTQWKTLAAICVLPFLFWWIRIPEFRKEATKSIDSDSWRLNPFTVTLSVYTDPFLGYTLHFMTMLLFS